MQRRDLSVALLASVAGGAALPKITQAQTCGSTGYAQTPAEQALNVVPTNCAYPPGYVDRYGTNTSPGVTDMSAAFSTAFRVAGKTYVSGSPAATFPGACSVRWGATGPYFLANTVNCSEIRGVVAYDETSGNASSTPQGITIGHSHHGFDLSGSTELSFNNLTVTTASGFVPQTLFFMARDSSGAGAGEHRFNNIRTSNFATFSNVFYSYGSEENIYLNCEILNAQAGSTCFNHNCTNTSGYSSAFITIASGSQSNSVHRHIGGSYFNFGNSGSGNEVVFQLEGCANFSFRDGLWHCPNGLAYVRVVGTVPSIFLTFDSIRGEPTSAQPVYGVDVVATGTTGVNSNVFWTFNNVYSNSSGELLNFAASTEVQNLTMRASGGVSGKLLSVYNMSHSIVEQGSSLVTGLAGGTIQSNYFVGSRSAITLNGSDVTNLFADTALGRFGVTGD